MHATARARPTSPAAAPAVLLLSLVVVALPADLHATNSIVDTSALEIPCGVPTGLITPPKLALNATGDRVYVRSGSPRHGALTTFTRTPVTGVRLVVGHLEQLASGPSGRGR